MNTSLLLIIITALAVALPAQDVKSTAGIIQSTNQQSTNLEADLAFLASDSLKGRNAGSDEDHVATRYIAARFLGLGLKPMGDNGTYFQEMDITTAEVDAAGTTLSATISGVKHTYAFDKDFHWSRQSLRSASASGQVVFAGYGIDAREYGYSDFSGIDVKGKVVLVLGREPQAGDAHSKFAGTWDTYHAFYWQKLEELRRRGAAGALIVQDAIPRDVKQTPASSLRAHGGPNFALAGQMWDIPTFTISRHMADQLLAPSGKTTGDLQTAIDRTLRPASLEVSASSVQMSKNFTGFQSHRGRNVVALLEGADPSLRSQAIIVTAHHDHMG